MKRHREEINEANAMWRSVRAEGRKRGAAFGADARDRLAKLQRAGVVHAAWHTDYHVTITRRQPQELDDLAVEFYPTRGTIVRLGVRENSVGLSAALKMLGVSE